ncbi:MAG: hypothetical protein HOU81_22115 [Hamadaea sp.]|uniref:hypothetical protein n=1 Tax=Hamadaea sp. TaxID=2024425 RepID=UPI0017DB6015|nr:hypothetical protein [Hamadaea sp.]NUR73524.1 hypothetical protein [Hamadaea sp.]NUT22669.1 hypothetical protein [Hamadaea sp.]
MESVEFAMEFVVLEFADPQPGAEFTARLRRIAAEQDFRIVDALILAKTTSGEIVLLDESVAGLIRDVDLDDVVAEIAPGTSAALLLLAHSWRVGTRTALRDAGGRVVLAERLPPSVSVRSLG